MSFKFIFTKCFVILLISNSLSYSQDTYTIQSKSTYIFTDNNEIKALKFDSSSIFGNDTIMYSHPNIITSLNNSDSCLQVKNNLFSSKIIKRASGNLVFFNRNWDSIFINTQGSVGSTWVMFNDTFPRYIEAKITLEDTMSIIPGVIDSVKFISMTFVNGNDNGKLVEPLVMSKNYGFVKFYPFYPFPHFDPVMNNAFDYIKFTLPFNFIGSSKPDIGFNHFNVFDIFQYEIGDEFHIENFDYPGGGFSSHQFEEVVINKIISPGNDSITYSFSRCNKFNNNTFTKDTIELIVTQTDSSLNLFPENFITSGSDYNSSVSQIYYYYNYHYRYNFCQYSGNINYPSMSSAYPRLIDYNISTNCWIPLYIVGPACNPYYGTYIYGLGGHYYCRNCIPEGYYANNLFYFKKGNITWGNPLNICSMVLKNETEKDSTTFFTLYPNPAKNEIEIKNNLKYEGNLSINFCDFTGRLIYKTNKQYVNSVIINIGSFKKGFYFCTLQDETGQKYFLKFIKTD